MTASQARGVGGFIARLHYATASLCCALIPGCRAMSFAVGNDR